MADAFGGDNFGFPLFGPIFGPHADRFRNIGADLGQAGVDTGNLAGDLLSALGFLQEDGGGEGSFLDFLLGLDLSEFLSDGEDTDTDPFPQPAPGPGPCPPGMSIDPQSGICRTDPVKIEDLPDIDPGDEPPDPGPGPVEPCPTGQIRGPLGNCIPITPPIPDPDPDPDPDPENPCPEGFVLSPLGNCVDPNVEDVPCPEGTTRQADGSCSSNPDPDPEPEPEPDPDPDPGPGPGTECPTGTIRVGNSCVPIAGGFHTCPDGSVRPIGVACPGDDDPGTDPNLCPNGQPRDANGNCPDDGDTDVPPGPGDEGFNFLDWLFNQVFSQNQTQTNTQNIGNFLGEDPFGSIFGEGGLAGLMEILLGDNDEIPSPEPLDPSTKILEQIFPGVFGDGRFQQSIDDLTFNQQGISQLEALLSQSILGSGGGASSQIVGFNPDGTPIFSGGGGILDTFNTGQDLINSLIPLSQSFAETGNPVNTRELFGEFAQNVSEPLFAQAAERAPGGVASSGFLAESGRIAENLGAQGAQAQIAANEAAAGRSFSGIQQAAQLAQLPLSNQFGALSDAFSLGSTGRAIDTGIQANPLSVFQSLAGLPTQFFQQGFDSSNDLKDILESLGGGSNTFTPSLIR